MNIEIDFKKIFENYTKNKIEDLGFIKANNENIKGVTYKLNYIDEGIREVSPAYCVSPEGFYGDKTIDNYIAEQNKDIEECFDDPEGLIICEKNNNEFNVKYNMGQMVTPFYPLLANMTFEKIDKKFYETIEEYWEELYCEHDMLAGIENTLDIGNGSGDGLFKDAINSYIDLDINRLKEVLKEYKDMFEKYEIKIDSFNTLLQSTEKSNDIEKIKKELFDFIYDIYDLSINGEKINLRDAQKTLETLENDYDFSISKGEHKEVVGILYFHLTPDYTEELEFHDEEKMIKTYKEQLDIAGINGIDYKVISSEENKRDGLSYELKKAYIGEFGDDYTKQDYIKDKKTKSNKEAR